MNSRYSIEILVLVLSLMVGAETSRAATPTATARVKWHTNYDMAYRFAQQQHKMLLIYFQPPVAARTVADRAGPTFGDPVRGALAAMAARPEDRPRLERFVLLRLPLDFVEMVDDKPIVLVDHPAFGELNGGPGIAILDLRHVDQPYYTYAVSLCPLTRGKYYQFQPEHLAVLMDLPPGTITQRTMVFAVRIHPEAPASTQGEANPVLYEEAASHSTYQAQIRVQGHHQWESRFHRIISRLLGRGTPGMPCEVVAESWPSENLVDSCVDCVASWRQSPGHWSAVRAQHASYGYDIQRGSNGIWYATGIFSN
jgi:hypothetical protein